MTVQFFRLRIKGTDKTKLETIEKWFNSKVDKKDLNIKLMTKRVKNNLDAKEKKIGVVEESNISEDFELKGVFTLNLDFFVNKTTSKNKYLDFVINKFKTFDKKGFTHVFIDVVENCTHDQEKPTPCVAKRVLEWTA